MIATSRVFMTGLCLFSLACSGASGELISFENENPGLSELAVFDPGRGHLILGQSLDLTHDSFNQPAIGELPSGSVMIMHIDGFLGDSIWLGMGTLTMTARSKNATLIPDPFAGELVPYYGPEHFSIDGLIDESTNFVDGWRALQIRNELTGDEGVFTVDRFFTVGVRFEQSDGVHFGFAAFERVIEYNNGQLGIHWRPIRWGYETIAGVGVRVVPAPSVLSLGGSLVFLGIGGRSIRPRREWTLR